ncbi:MAG: ABC transporter ATP-binding protein [Phototrophicaceae bacterium]
MFGMRNRPTPSNREKLPKGERIDIRRLLRYLTKYRLRLIVAGMALLTSSGLSLVFPTIVGRVLDTILEQNNHALLNQITLGLLAVFFVRSVTTLIENYNIGYIGEKITIDLRKELYTHLQGMSIDFFTNHRVGELVSRLTSDVTVMRNALTNNVNMLFQQSFIAIGSVVVMVYTNWRLSLFILVLTPLIGALGALFGTWLRRASTDIQDELASATVVVDEVFQAIRIVKSFVREPYEIERYSQAIQRAFEATLRVLRIRSLFGPIVAFMAFGSLALILWFGGSEVINGRLSGGELVSFLIYGLTVAGSFGTLVSLYTQFQEALGSTYRVFQLLDEQPTITDLPNAQALPTISGSILLDDVSFGYEEQLDILHHISLDIPAGEILALVGPSGAGKSTLFNLIPRFYDPTSGSVSIDGYPIQTITQNSLREQIAIVPQETILFGGSILENIRYGKQDATETEIIEAAKVANAHDFISEFPNGYETIVGERGIRLSGGQRQRVAIARAVLKNARILLLDEATSSLDSESEHEVQEALDRLMQGRTTIIIAHRLSTIQVAHRIAVLNKGNLVELGTHTELMQTNGLYASLYRMQFENQSGGTV